ncbi:uncharacterized protein FOMMEDRAFT_147410 [Fomitiporia mediterranea MF3/22]|uniref:uncharacterized protein n=1 Tax=Fomitiporia mediterranea (strain MF3/22) TaxID=694068 RepID=UPI0004407906|nr:uncharacterized protein FOMMEDRAFT_147410 [Fomitiporia mediterranea MF3/22]EJD02441.1 hypothetical protein FOMMEDRAFT_147410 [Fomitiporia mediterranea MF3/22]
MPAGHPLISPTDSSQLADDTPQIKRCSGCQGPLNAEAPTATQLYSPESIENTNLCNACRDSRTVTCSPLVVYPGLSVVADGVREIDVSRRVIRNVKHDNMPMCIDGLLETDSSSSDEESEPHGEGRSAFAIDNSCQINPSSVPQSSLSIPIPVSTSSLQRSYPQRNVSPRSVSPTLRFIPPRSPVRQTYPSSGQIHPTLTHDIDHDDGYPDPLVDITRLRVRSKGYRCLQPGATFRGTQKSGRNSYDVNVTIVDVDFASSFLCGYLCIRGLTDDWPELTTYFDAQIIGMRHGFDTQDWGASRQEDMVHWARFPAFRALQKELIEPRMLLPANTSRPAVFMRWKERFLVPDHRVEDISGASFAGFYYVCVDFDPEPQSTPPSSRVLADELPVCMESGFASYPEEPLPEPRGGANEELSSRRQNPWDEPAEVPTARMCGFYYHKNSEPSLPFELRVSLRLDRGGGGAEDWYGSIEGGRSRFSLVRMAKKIKKRKGSETVTKADVDVGGILLINVSVGNKK